MLLQFFIGDFIEKFALKLPLSLISVCRRNVAVHFYVIKTHNREREGLQTDLFVVVVAIL